jgi:hypothetical protein
MEHGPTTLNPKQAAIGKGLEMSQALVTMIDSALEQYRSRDLVSAAEVVDFLLDLRLAAISPDADPLEQLLEQESTHAGN